MKKLLFVLVLSLLPFVLKAQDTSGSDTTIYNTQDVEFPPSFKGGKDKFYRFIAHTFHYPANAKEKNIQGKVEVTFIVNTDGSLTDIKISTSVAPDIDADILRVMKLCPKWIPGSKFGIPVRCIITMPIRVTLG